jgi:hypothetical protein
MQIIIKLFSDRDYFSTIKKKLLTDNKSKIHYYRIELYYV